MTGFMKKTKKTGFSGRHFLPTKRLTQEIDEVTALQICLIQSENTVFSH